MRVGADALMDFVAAPAARAPEPDAPRADAPRFEEHLDAVSSETEATAPDEQSASAPAEVAEDQPPEPPAPIAAAAATQPPPAQPALIQILTSLGAASAQTTEGTETAPPQSAASPDLAGAAPAAPLLAAAQQPLKPSRARADGAAGKPSAVAKSLQSASPPLDAAQAQTSIEAPTTQTGTAQPHQPQQAVAHTIQPQPHAPAQQQPQQMPPQRAPNETPSATQLIASTVRQAASDNTAAPDAQIQSGASAEPRPISGPGSAPQNAPAPASAKRAAPAKAIAAHSGPAPAATKDNFAALLANAVEARDAQGQSATSSQSLGALSSASGAAPASAQLEAGVHRAAPAAAQVGREIIRRFGGENTRFELRLDPPELGRVEVRLEVSRDHRVTAIVAAESPQALAELARHARDLEQTLQSAGLELAENGLSFDLSERQARASPENAPTPRRTDQAMTDAPEQTLRATPIGLERWRGQRVDLVA